MSTAASSHSLIHQKCVITGASRGIGKAIAQRFAQDGASCTLVGRDEVTLKTVLQSLGQKEGSNHEIRVGDIRERNFWEELIKEVVSRGETREYQLNDVVAEGCGNMCQCCRYYTLQPAGHDQSSVD